MSRLPRRKVRIIGGALGAGMVVVGCTTFVRPTTCTRGLTSCGGISDARFCDYVALVVEGADCPDLGVAPAKPFCVVTAGRACIDTNYAVRDRHCKVLQYQSVSDGNRADCPPGAPMFVNR
jgi:hypothetical protein